MTVFGLFAFLLSADAMADETLAAGQVWSFKNAPSDKARVQIHVIETESDPWIAHVSVSGLVLQRDPGPLNSGVSSRFSAEDDPDAFWCQYEMVPSANRKNIDINVVYLPIEYSALAASVVSLEASDQPSDVYFERAMDNWDYFRDEYGLDDPRAFIARRPLDETAGIILEKAGRSFSMFRRILPELQKQWEEM